MPDMSPEFTRAYDTSERKYDQPQTPIHVKAFV